MPLAPQQIRKLKARLNPRHVRSREVEGKEISYLEGWHVIAEANRIFGFDGWDRELVDSSCVYTRQQGERFNAAYVARIRIKVRAGEHTITREGSGAGESSASSPGQAHELALKAAETDATKRALMTFGNPFGLSLYGTAREEREPAPRSASANEAARARRNGHAAQPAGNAVNEHGASEGQEGAGNGNGARRYWAAVQATDSDGVSAHAYRADLPEPGAPTDAAPVAPQAGNGTGRAGTPEAGASAYAIRSSALTEVNFETLGEQTACGEGQGGSLPETASPVPAPASAMAVPRPRIDKSALALNEPTRIRDAVHLKFVASKPCLICGRNRAQAHHLRFAQPKAMGRKVSDEYTVPLCSLHHQMLHQTGNEIAWWEYQNIDPLTVAAELWRQSRAGNSAQSDPEPERDEGAAKAASQNRTADSNSPP